MKQNPLYLERYIHNYVVVHTVCASVHHRFKVCVRNFFVCIFFVNNYKSLDPNVIKLCFLYEIRSITAYYAIWCSLSKVGMRGDTFISLSFLDQILSAEFLSKISSIQRFFVYFDKVQVVWKSHKISKKKSPAFFDATE